MISLSHPNFFEFALWFFVNFVSKSNCWLSSAFLDFTQGMTNSEWNYWGPNHYSIDFHSATVLYLVVSQGQWNFFSKLFICVHDKKKSVIKMLFCKAYVFGLMAILAHANQEIPSKMTVVSGLWKFGVKSGFLNSYLFISFLLHFIAFLLHLSNFRFFLHWK